MVLYRWPEIQFHVRNHSWPLYKKVYSQHRSLFEQSLQYLSARCCIPSFNYIIHSVQKKKNVKGFYHLCRRRLTSSSDFNYFHKFWSPWLMKVEYEIWLQYFQWFQGKSCLKLMKSEWPWIKVKVLICLLEVTSCIYPCTYLVYYIYRHLYHIFE